MATSERCPKCTHILTGDYDVTLKYGPIPVIKCMSCGFRRYPEMAPAMQLSLEQKQVAASKSRTSKYSQEIARIIAEHSFTIGLMRGAQPPVPWTSIESFIRKKCGKPIKRETIKKYYEEMRARA